MRKYNRIKCLGVIFILLFCQTVMPHSKIKAAKQLDAGINVADGTMRVGDRAYVKCGKEGVRYKSSDPSVAYVNETGTVTAKKPGKVHIKVLPPKGKAGTYRGKTIPLQVIKKDKFPNLLVALDELVVGEPTLALNNAGELILRVPVKSHADAKVKKIKLVYDMTADEPMQTAAPAPATKEAVQGVSDTNTKQIHTKLVLKAKGIKAGGRKVLKIRLGMVDKDSVKLRLKKYILWSGAAKVSYQYKEKDASKVKYRFGWGTKDKKPPVITGWVKGKSIYNGEPCLVCYTDKKNSYNFKKYVKAKDERRGKVKLSVDTSKVNWKKEGIYKVWYSATDKAGNSRKTWAKIQVTKPGRLESIADQVLAQISRKSWSDTKKARAIYSYVKSHCTYTHSGPHSNWKAVAVEGFLYHSGDCFTYYAMARALLSRAGIPNLTITRYPLRNGAHHWWSLAYVQGGWYHLDTTPRTGGGYFCLVTDAQLREYRNSGAFHYVSSKYPVRAVKRISRGCNS